MSPENVVSITDQNGFCRVKHKTWLWKQCEVTGHLDIKDLHDYPYWLICDGLPEPRGVFGATDPVLIKACEFKEN